MDGHTDTHIDRMVISLNYIFFFRREVGYKIHGNKKKPLEQFCCLDASGV
jgi:hypothetical protein